MSTLREEARCILKTQADPPTHLPTRARAGTRGTKGKFGASIPLEPAWSWNEEQGKEREWVLVGDGVKEGPWDRESVCLGTQRNERK